MTSKDDKKIRALFMVPALLRGGAETQAIDLINSIDNSRFEKHLLVFEKELDQLERVDQTEVEFHHVVRSGKFDFLFVKKISQIIDAKKIDVIHCTLQISLLYAWLARRISKRKPKLVVAIHTTTNVTKKNELIDQLLYRQLIKSCSNVIFVCHTQMKYWLNKYPELKSKSRVVYNGVDSDYFNPDDFISEGLFLKKKLGIDSNPTIACIAGFRREKAHQILLQAFSRLPENVHLILAGDGQLRSEIELTINQLGLSNRVHLMGNVDDVRPVLAATDVTVLTSTAVETFSMAMLESMSMSVPMVATDIGGLSEAIIPGETGGLVSPEDVAGLAYALSRYVINREYATSMGSRSRALVVEKFSKSFMVRDTERVLVETVD